MKKQVSDSRQVLNALGKLTAFLSEMGPDVSRADCFDYPLEIIRQTLLFDVSVLYKVSNLINDRLILEVVKVVDPDNSRMDLAEGRKIRLFMDARDKRYVNEVHAFADRKTSHINVAGMGCDIMGYVFFPREFGGAYLFGGDYLGKEARVKDFEVAAMDIMCNILSTLLLKTRFKRQAEVDDLTGLFNAGRIKEELNRVIRRLERNPVTRACVAMGDIDFFKSVNDTWGHIQGDVVLKEMGELLSDSLRQYLDVVGRYGGEEFLIILDETPAAAATEIIGRIRQKIEAHGFTRVSETGQAIENEVLQLTMSFGVAEAGKDILDPEDWVGRADKALYMSKQGGRNRVTLFPRDEDGPAA